MNDLTELAIWTRYDSLGGSSRLRFHIYRQILAQHGFSTHYRHFFDNAYLQRLYSGKGKSPAALLAATLRRTRELKAIPANTPKLIEYELFPYLPWLWEKRFLRAPYILNFDDAVDLRYRKLPWLSAKYPKLISGAAGVIVANDQLAAAYGKFNDNLIKIPTVPPQNPVPPDNAGKFQRFTIGWIGTPVTYPFLQQLAPVLRRAAETLDFEVLVIATPDLPPLEGVTTKCVQWSEDNEMSLLRKCHIGIMPLPDTPFARGKSAYKLIQYLCANIPAIASPVGENNIVIRNGKTGFTAASPDEWLSALHTLANADTRRKMEPEIQRAAADYSLSRWGEVLADFLKKSLHR